MTATILPTRTLVSNTAASVKIHKLPQYTKYVSYNAARNGEIEFLFWMKDVVCKYDFFDPQKRSLDAYAQDLTDDDKNTNPLYGFDNAFYPRNGSSDTLQSALKVAKKAGLENIVFSCLARVKISTRTQYITDTIKFYGVEFALSEDDKKVLSTREYSLPNTSGGVPCWGYRTDVNPGRSWQTDIARMNVGTAAGKVNTFINTTFNNDYLYLCTWVKTIEEKKSAKKLSTNISSTMFLNVDHGYDAFMTISRKDNPVAYFRMFAAGFRPSDSDSSFMMIPLKSGTMNYDGTDYEGYVTQNDKIGKGWFVTETGHLLGQVDG